MPDDDGAPPPLHPKVALYNHDTLAGCEYVIETDGNRAVIFSSGPDGEIGTDDDVYSG